MKGLSKSRYTLYCQCPKALWLRVYKPEVAEVDDSLQARFEQGNVVGDLAMGLFGDYKEAYAEKPEGSLDLMKMMEQTKVWMDEGVENICEASFALEGHYCAVDILHKTADGWAIYEVKSTSFPEFNGKVAKLEKYAPDIAYQKCVLTQCGIHVTGTFLVCLNSDYVRQGELDIQELFVIKDMQDLVANEYDKVQTRVARALKLINQVEEPADDLSERCNKPYHCGFWTYCSSHLPKPSVFDVYGGSFSSKGPDRFFINRKLECYRAGKCSFDDLKEEPLGHIQRLQVERREYIDREGIARFLDTLSYPLYFLDFETMQDPIPQFDGAKVYAQIPFQYSLHIKRSADADYEHTAFLAKSNGKDPRRELAEQLCQDIPMGVCTLAYNKKFEVGRIEELATLYPDLSVHLLDIARHICDLLDPFEAGYYYLPAMGGSFSIKSVLPALFPDEPSLNYHNLDERVQNGGDAMTIFPRIKDMPPAEAEASRTALLNYCKLDTWAMVKVWEKLQETQQS